MYKKLFLILTIVVAGLEAKIYFPENTSLANLKSKKQTYSIAWDIHNVLAEKENKFGKLIKNGFTIGIPYLFGNDGWDEIKRVSKQEDISGEGQSTILAKHGHTDLAKQVEKAANEYKPRKGMDQIVYELHNKGITQRLASNIGPRFLNNLNAKFKTKYNCTMFDIIKEGKIIDYNQYSNQQTRQPLPSHLTVHCKPHPAFYQDYNITYNKNGVIVFIDDKLENVQAATKAGWIGIHFDLKNKQPVTQLRKDLVMLDIL